MTLRMLALVAAVGFTAGAAQAQSQAPAAPAPSSTALAQASPAAADAQAASAPAPVLPASSSLLGDPAALKAGEPGVVSNGPVPDTAENRAKYGSPDSATGRRTKTAGN